MSKRKHWDTWGQSSPSSKEHVKDFGDDDSRFCFVSHSGAHKHFAELLCRELEARGCSAFFDRESDSPAKGEASGAATLGVAAACRLGILLLSEEFFTASKWPMMELVELLKENQRGTGADDATEANILPVFFRLSITNLMLTHSKSKTKPVWSQTHWETWARDDPRVNVDAWEKVWERIDKFDAIHICLQQGQRHAQRQAQRMINDDEGRSMIVAKVLTDPTYGFADPHPATSFPRAAPQCLLSLDVTAPQYVLSLDAPSLVLQLATAASVIPRAAPAIPRPAPAIPLALSVIPHAAPVSQYSKGECSQNLKSVTTNTNDDSDKDDGSDKADHEGSGKGIENEESGPDDQPTPSDKDQHDSDEESVEQEEGEDEGVQSENEEDDDEAEDDDDYDASDDGDDDDNNTDSGSDGDNSG